MAHEFEIFFNDGVVTASEPNGPPLAQGDLNGVRAFDNLSQLEGVERGFIVRPAKVVFRWGGGWNFLRIFRPSVAFVGMSLRIVNVLELDVASSSFLRGTQQVQVYQGEFQLAWENVIRQGWLRWLARQAGPGSTNIQGTLTMTYPPVAEAAIAGTGAGQILPPGLPGANSAVAATFDSGVPERLDQQVAQFNVKHLVLRGTWS